MYTECFRCSVHSPKEPICLFAVLNKRLTCSEMSVAMVTPLSADYGLVACGPGGFSLKLMLCDIFELRNVLCRLLPLIFSIDLCCVTLRKGCNQAYIHLSVHSSIHPGAFQECWWFITCPTAPLMPQDGSVCQQSPPPAPIYHPARSCFTPRPHVFSSYLEKPLSSSSNVEKSPKCAPSSANSGSKTSFSLCVFVAAALCFSEPDSNGNRTPVGGAALGTMVNQGDGKITAYLFFPRCYFVP